MNSEETNVELRVAETKDAEAEPKDAAEPPAQDAADADATEADVSEADLDQEEQEKQLMTGGRGGRGGDRAADHDAAAPVAEKNGSVKLKIPEEAAEAKFTGLNKEELLRVAGTPG
ncbi:hypothetical protein F2P81_002951 [Scophthalmus maximus]|nr:hypothetical protein F2P81_002951 [Scophthalmus maximus]